MFTALGLGQVDEAVYRVLVEIPGLGVKEIAARLEIEPDRVRECLDRLFECKLIQQSFEIPGCFITVDLSVGLQNLLARQHEELIDRQRKIAEDHSAFIRLITSRSVAPAVTSQVERLEGMDAVQQRLVQLSHAATKSVLTFMSGGPQSPSALAAARSNSALLLDRGVAVRTIGLDSVRDDPATTGYTRWLSDHGGEFRTAPSLPPRMIIVDHQCVLVPLDPANTRRGALSCTDAGTVALLTALFDQTWNISTPLGSDRATHRDCLSDSERALLTLIAQGHTDESAANALHVSPRTARRTMASILERLGARSRFEAGLKAAQKGWL